MLKSIVALFVLNSQICHILVASFTRLSSPLNMKGDASCRTSNGVRINGKQIIFIRHGCTNMNEYLSQEGCRWGDSNFTDVFSDDQMDFYRDTTLSSLGVKQAELLCKTLSSENWRTVLENVELVVVSPLTRALQTLEIGFAPLISRAVLNNKSLKQKDEVDSSSSKLSSEVSFLAHPLAAERCYLVSDLGSETTKLSKNFPFVDFSSEFEGKVDMWWFSPDEETSNYNEWRPSGQGQIYACPGEPDIIFNNRMVKLYDWLDSRPEQTISLVCHWGVLQWFTGRDFQNCEVEKIHFDELNREGFMKRDEEA